MKENIDLVSEMEEEEDDDDDDDDEESSDISEKEKKTIAVLKQEEELKTLFSLAVTKVVQAVDGYRFKKKHKEAQEAQEAQEEKRHTMLKLKPVDIFDRTKNEQEKEKDGDGEGGETKAAAPAAPAAPTAPTETIEQVYRERMQKHLFKMLNITTHHYSSSIQSDKSAAKKRSKKLKRDLKQLKKDLPLEFGSSIFVRVDKARPQVIQCMITGPGETPYDSGCFQFDIFCPADFPSGPPKVNLQTTGAGQVRFNPNLYNCGKVCLSLLGKSVFF